MGLADLLTRNHSRMAAVIFPVAIGYGCAPGDVTVNSDALGPSQCKRFVCKGRFLFKVGVSIFNSVWLEARVDPCGRVASRPADYTRVRAGLCTL